MSWRCVVGCLLLGGVLLGLPGAAWAEYRITEHSVALPAIGQEVHYLLYEPQQLSEKARHPLAIALYGAGGSLKEYDFKGPGFADLREQLDRRGYFVVVPDLGPRHCMNDRAMLTMDLLLTELRKDERFDAERVDLLGTSMGAGSALAYALHQPKHVCSVVDHAGMSDFAVWIQENPQYRESVEAALGGSPEQVPAAYHQRSAVENARRLRQIPILMIHGTLDDVVLPTQSTRLHAALQAQHGKSVLRLVEGGIHNNQSMAGLGVEVADFLESARARAGKSHSAPAAKPKSRKSP